MPDLCATVASATPEAPSPRLWTSDARASWSGVGRLVDAHNILQTVMAQLTGGLFLTGLALALGAQELVIGLLAALPLLAKLSQLYLSWRIERAGRWRRVALVSGVIGRIPLVSVALLALAPPGPVTLVLLVVALACSALGGSAFELSFLTWMAELIPEPLRGVFWGRRGQIGGAVGTIASLIAAWLIGDATPASANFPRVRLGMVFALGGAAGLIGLLFLRCLPEPRRLATRAEQAGLRASLAMPLRDANYRRLLAFSSAWSFSAGFMAPFYMVYMLRELRLSFLAITLLTAVTSVLMAATQVHWGRLGDHFGTKPVLRIGAYLITLTPLLWLLTRPHRVWPLVIVQVLSGLGWSAVHVSLSNLTLKLSPQDKRPSYLATFGAATGVAEGVAPLVGGMALAIAEAAALSPHVAYRCMMVLQLVLFAATTVLPSWIQEPGGTAVGHLIRVMARFRSMDASCPAKLIFEHAYTHLARLADIIARDFPHDAEPIGE
jgi:MFS family permease